MNEMYSGDFGESFDFNTIDDYFSEIEGVYNLFFGSTCLEDSFINGIDARYRGEA